MTEHPVDNFKSYFTEKLWEMIPSIYRHEDGIAENAGVLRALVEILAEQAAILRRSHDRLWEDQFIELCNDWAVPYIGDLLGTRLVSALNSRGMRIDVAKTIYYRRRKGTPRLLEELISDITGWEGVVVENFRRLGRTRHGLDPKPLPLAGRFSGTMPGGWAELRQPRGAGLRGGPFDEFHYTADFRQHRGLGGRYNIPKLAFHLYRLAAFRVEGVTPFGRADGKSFTFDPSGRGDQPLFMPRNRPDDWDTWRSTREWDLPAPMRCHILGHAEYVIKESIVRSLVDRHNLSEAAAGELRTLRGMLFRDESRLRETLSTFSNNAELLKDTIYFPLLHEAIIDDCGKRALLPDKRKKALHIEEAPGDEVAREQIASGDLGTFTVNLTDKRLVVDPEKGRFLFPGDPPADDITVTYYYGFSGEIGAGTYSRRTVEELNPDQIHTGGGALTAPGIENDGITQINDSATYGPVSDKLNVKALIMQAANHQRPYLRLESNWILNTGANADSRVILDGLWIGSTIDDQLILRGNYEKVLIRHTTLDPGGENVDGDPIPPVALVIEAQVEELVIEASITGPVRTDAGGVVEKLVVRDSIIQSINPALPALSIGAGEVHMKRTTVSGAMEVHRLYASETLVTDSATVTDTQNGCFRFSAAKEGSRLPRPYESHTITNAHHYFTSSRFGHPGYGQLSKTVPIELKRGAENGSEIGAFSGLINPIKSDSLRTKVNEFMPFGLIRIFIEET